MDASLPSCPVGGGGEAVTSIAVLDIELAKHVFQVQSVDAHGRALVSKRVSRAKLANIVVQLAP